MTPAAVVFPRFLFLVGVSIPLATFRGERGPAELPLWGRVKL